MSVCEVMSGIRRLQEGTRFGRDRTIVTPVARPATRRPHRAFASPISPAVERIGAALREQRARPPAAVTRACVARDALLSARCSRY
jgi:hypothetical protein